MKNIMIQALRDSRRSFPPSKIGMNELYTMSDKLKKGKNTKEKLITNYEGEVKSLGKFSELDGDRKKRLQEEKSDLHSTVAAKTKTQNMLSMHKVKY